MDDSIVQEVKKIESAGATEIEMLALVSATSFEVAFYGSCNGQRIQSNAMVEAGLIESDIVENFYKNIAQAVRADSRFDKDKMNIVKYHKNGTIEFIHDEKNCRVYAIKKDWKKSL